MSRSSRTLSNPEVRFHSEGTEFLGGSGAGSGTLEDEGPATGEVTGAMLLGTGLREGGVTGPVLCIGEIGGEARKSERRD